MNSLVRSIPTGASSASPFWRLLRRLTLVNGTVEKVTVSQEQQPRNVDLKYSKLGATTLRFADGEGIWNVLRIPLVIYLTESDEEMSMNTLLHLIINDYPRDVREAAVESLDVFLRRGAEYS